MTISQGENVCFPFQNKYNTYTIVIKQFPLFFSYLLCARPCIILFYLINQISSPVNISLRRRDEGEQVANFGYINYTEMQIIQ